LRRAKPVWLKNMEWSSLKHPLRICAAAAMHSVTIGPFHLA